jgi:hypothetical protein
MEASRVTEQEAEALNRLFASMNKPKEAENDGKNR